MPEMFTIYRPSKAEEEALDDSLIDYENTVAQEKGIKVFDLNNKRNSESIPNRLIVSPALPFNDLTVVPNAYFLHDVAPPRIVKGRIFNAFYDRHADTFRQMNGLDKGDQVILLLRGVIDFKIPQGFTKIKAHCGRDNLKDYLLFFWRGADLRVKFTRKITERFRF